MSKLKKLIRCAAFLLVFCTLLLWVQDRVTPNWDWPDYGERMNKAISGIYSEARDSLDVFWLGTSHMQYGVSPMQVYRHTGIRSYNLATAGQPLLLSYYRLKYALKEQRPKVVFLDASACFYTDLSNRGYKRWFKAISCFHLDRLGERIELAAIMPLLNTEGDSFTQSVGAALPILRFHSNYMLNEYSFLDLHTENVYPQKGQTVSTRTKPAGSSGSVGDGGDPDADLAEDEALDRNDANLVAKLKKRLSANLEDLERIAELCGKNDCELVITKMPVYETPSAFSGDWPREKHDLMAEWCDAHRLEFLDLNYESVNIDWSQDTCDGGGHMNKRGAIKVSDFLANWLTDRYTFDREGQGEIEASWNKQLAVYDTQMRYMDLTMINDLRFYLSCLGDGRYTVLCTVCGPAGGGWTEEVQARFAEASGSEIDLFETWRDAPGAVYAGAFGSGVPIQEKLEENKCALSGTLDDGKAYRLSGTGAQSAKTASIVIDGIEYAVPGKGVCFVVYDNDMGCVVDSATFSTRQDAMSATHGSGFVKAFRARWLAYEDELLDDI